MVVLVKRTRRLSPLILALLLLSSAAHAQTPSITVTVLGADNEPKPHVAVDVLGAKRVYSQTGASGSFEVELPPGRYVFRVREGRRRMEFQRQVSAEEQNLTLTITW